jgi:hypothetical protein
MSNNQPAMSATQHLVTDKLGREKKTNLGLRTAPAPMRDLPTTAFFRAAALLRRNGPVPGILAARRPGAIMDKSGRPHVATLQTRPAEIITINH